MDGRTITIADLEKLTDRLIDVPSVRAGLAPLSAKCEASARQQLLDGRRVQCLMRGLTKPLEPLLADPASGLKRAHLPQLQQAFRQILGDAVWETRCRQAKAVAENCREHGPVNWDVFQKHPEFVLLREAILVSVARRFLDAPFETRKGWFKVVMNHSPTAVSVDPNMFIVRKVERERAPFDDAVFARTMQALFSPVHPSTYNSEDEEAFVARWKATPGKIFGRLFVELRKSKSKQWGHTCRR